MLKILSRTQPTHENRKEPRDRDHRHQRSGGRDNRGGRGFGGREGRGFKKEMFIAPRGEVFFMGHPGGETTTQAPVISVPQAIRIQEEEEDIKDVKMIEPVSLPYISLSILHCYHP